MSRSPRITIFKWGYEGWGNATRTLVRSVDAVERERGREAPIFVDIRYSRSVRAIGFRDHAFESMLGHKRYRWMRSLGNEAIRTRRGGNRIQCKDAAQRLLDLAIDAAATNKRIIFFCSCSSRDGAHCHRHGVAKLVARAARRRRVRVEIEEWPGGEPGAVETLLVRVDEDLRKVRNGAVSVALTNRQATGVIAATPWGGLVELVSRGDRQMVSAGPPQFRARRWQLPIFLFPVVEEDKGTHLLRYTRRLRSSAKLDPVRS